jgi:uncharacterized membrane protein YfcA
MLSLLDLSLIGVASVAAGAVNALAGGGTLITFPTLTALGVPALAANVTNAVGLCPGYAAATLAQWSDLAGQERRLWVCLPAGIAGGIAGAVLLVNTQERMFRAAVPFLILLAAGLLAAREPVGAWVAARRVRAGSAKDGDRWAALPVGFAAIYGGYFGAALSVIVLAVLGVTMEDTLTRLNALKQAIALAVNVAAVLFLVFSGEVVWPAAAVMAVSSLAGGALGGRLAGRVPAATLQWSVVAIGVVVAVVYLAR